MPGLEPGIQAAPSVIIPRTSALDARVKPAHDEPERVPLALSLDLGAGLEIFVPSSGARAVSKESRQPSRATFLLAISITSP